MDAPSLAVPIKPETNRFPLAKYGLLAERMAAEGHGSHEAEAVPPWLEAVHDPELVGRLAQRRPQRARGARARPPVVARAGRAQPPLGGGDDRRRAVRDRRRPVHMNLGGGTHHAGRAFARGYCVFNDVAVALSRLQQ